MIEDPYEYLRDVQKLTACDVVPARKGMQGIVAVQIAAADAILDLDERLRRLEKARGPLVGLVVFYALGRLFFYATGHGWTW